VCINITIKREFALIYIDVLFIHFTTCELVTIFRLLHFRSIPPAAAMRAEEQLRLGLQRILDLAGERAHVAMDKAT
jgi:hypothetical protein